MKITTILGSARLKGNTATILARFERLASELGEVERVNLSTLHLHGCRGCDACQRTPDSPGCLQQDDLSRVIAGLLTADVIIYASPLYCWDFTAQMKMLIDRQYCLTKWQDGRVAQSLLAGKLTALLVTCGDVVEHNADLLPLIFERVMHCGDCRVFGQYIVPNCSLPSAFKGEPEITARAMLSDLRAALPAA